ncbi:MAG: hypothetical protein Q8J78_10325 [Moraxellaceae bacterium]|nr:hypothetical protein [Moraxellaceae bacterium]
MKALWLLFWDLCRLRRGPEEVPYSLPLLAVVVALDVALNLTGHVLAAPDALMRGVQLTLMGLLLEMLVLASLLRFKGLQERFVQSFTAIIGVDLLLSVLALSFTLLSLAVEPKSPVIGLVVIAQMLIVGWNLALRGFIYHRALNIGLLQGIMLSLALFLLNIFLSVQLFPGLLQKNG